MEKVEKRDPLQNNPVTKQSLSNCGKVYLESHTPVSDIYQHVDHELREMSVYYNGEVDVRLRRHGKGQYAYPNAVFRFDGKWFDGCKHGEGKFVVEDGSTFEGNFVDGEIEGIGRKTWPDGRRYKGKFSRGEASGEGSFTSPTGESYAGAWAFNRRHGKGELVLPNGQGTYVGEFDSHRFHGDGRLALASGFQYTGIFSCGRPHGYGSATYPGGSTFTGPYESGLKSGTGGIYYCGVTQITFSGEWKASIVISPPMKLAIEADIEAADKVNAPEQSKGKPPPGGKAGKGAKGPAKGKPPAKGSKQQAAEEEEPDGEGFEKPVVAKYDDAGRVVGLWCRCVRDAQVVVKSPKAVDAAEEGNDTGTRRTSKPPPEVVSVESGRSLAVTLHQVKPDSTPLELGPPVSFFVRRQDANDASEALGRFSTGGLASLFPMDKRHWPTGCKERLEFGVAAEAVDAIGDGEVDKEALEARWQTILGNLGSNRCVILPAGQNLSLTTPRNCIARESNRSSSKTVEDSDDQRPEHEQGYEQTGSGTLSVPDRAGKTQRSVQVSNITPLYDFTLCLDFRLDLNVEALASEDGESDESGIVKSGRDQPLKEVMLVACGRHVKVSATLSSLIPPRELRDSEAGDDAELVDPAAGPPGPRPSTTGAPAVVGIGDDNNAPARTWHFHSISARCGSRLVSLLCSNCDFDGGARQSSHPWRKSIDGMKDRKDNEAVPEEMEKIDCDSSVWHSLALAVDLRADASLLCVDGKLFPLRKVTKAEGASPLPLGDNYKISDDKIVIGGTGGNWANLAVKNLAVYNERLDDERLGTITRVYRDWRSEEGLAVATESREDERWLAEAHQAKEDEREAEERPEHLPGASSATVMHRTTVRGEAKLDRIILPKVAREGEGWVLRVADVSGAVEENSGDSAPPKCKTQLAVATDEEKNAFPPLPAEIVRLELG